MSSVLSDISTLISNGVIVWITAFVQCIQANPLLLIACGLSLVGSAIEIIRRLLHVHTG